MSDASNTAQAGCAHGRPNRMDCSICMMIDQGGADSASARCQCSRASGNVNCPVHRPASSTAGVREKLAEEAGDKLTGTDCYQEPMHTKRVFKAGWDARDEEVRELKQQVDLLLPKASLAVRTEYENKRLREALDIADLKMREIHLYLAHKEITDTTAAVMNLLKAAVDRTAASLKEGVRNE